MFIFPRGQSRLAQIFSARYLEFVPENTIKGVNLPAKVGISLII